MKTCYLVCLAAIVGIVPAFAQPTVLAGVENFHQVNESLYRGGQPTLEGLKNLADLGVKTIVDLRHGKDHSDTEQRAAEGFGIHYINVPMEGLTAPTDRQIADLLAVLNTAGDGPVFVHCREGKDRTGTVIACYRIAHDHWNNAQALDEAKSYGLHSDQHPRQKFILNFHDTAPQTAASGVESSHASAGLLRVA